MLLSVWPETHDFKIVLGLLLALVLEIPRQIDDEKDWARAVPGQTLLNLRRQQLFNLREIGGNSDLWIWF